MQFSVDSVEILLDGTFRKFHFGSNLPVTEPLSGGGLTACGTAKQVNHSVVQTTTTNTTNTKESKATSSPKISKVENNVSFVIECKYIFVLKKSRVKIMHML